MSQSQLSPLVRPKHEEPARLGDDGGVLVAAAQLDDQILPDPKLGGHVLGELGLAEGEDGARDRDLGLLGGSHLDCLSVARARGLYLFLDDHRAPSKLFPLEIVGWMDEQIENVRVFRDTADHVIRA